MNITSLKLRRAIAYLKDGKSITEAAEMAGVERSTIYRSELYRNLTMEKPALKLEEIFPERYIMISRLPATSDPRDPLFEVRVKLANNVAGKRLFTDVKQLLAAIPQMAFEL